MKVLIVTSDHKLELKEIPVPKIGHFQALVKILACGICSTTDIELINGSQPYHQDYPCLLGHEAIGEVVEVGKGVRSFKLGDWVTRPAGIVPGRHREGLFSAWGGYAEYGLVTDLKAMTAAGDHSMVEDYTALRQNVLDGGRQIGLQASVLSIALAETLSWSNKLNLQDSFVCINGTGIAGLSLTLWARLAGAKKVIVLGRRVERLQLAKELGADETINIRDNVALDEVLELSGGGVDVFVEATGVPSQMEIAIQSIRCGGTVAVYGVAPNGKYELDWRWLPADIRITSHEPMEHLARQDVIRFMAQGKIQVDKLMTHQWPLRSFEMAFSAVRKGMVVKSMIYF